MTKCARDLALLLPSLTLFLPSPSKIFFLVCVLWLCLHHLSRSSLTLQRERLAGDSIYSIEWRYKFQSLFVCKLYKSRRKYQILVSRTKHELPYSIVPCQCKYRRQNYRTDWNSGPPERRAKYPPPTHGCIIALFWIQILQIIYINNIIQVYTFYFGIDSSDPGTLVYSLF